MSHSLCNLWPLSNIPSFFFKSFLFHSLESLIYIYAGYYPLAHITIFSLSLSYQMTVGCISRLHSGYLSRRFHLLDVWKLFASRIAVDQQAHENQLKISRLGFSPTNAIMSILDEDHFRAYSHKMKLICNPGQDSLLWGTPFLVKDNFCTDWTKWGLPTTCASLALKSFRAPYDASVGKNWSAFLFRYRSNNFCLWIHLFGAAVKISIVFVAPQSFQ